MPAAPPIAIDEIVRRFQEAKQNSIQALADEVGWTRGHLHKRVRAYLDEHPEGPPPRDAVTDRDLGDETHGQL